MEFIKLKKLTVNYAFNQFEFNLEISASANNMQVIKKNLEETIPNAKSHNALKIKKSQFKFYAARKTCQSQIKIHFNAYQNIRTQIFCMQVIKIFGALEGKSPQGFSSA